MNKIKQMFFRILVVTLLLQPLFITSSQADFFGDLINGSKGFLEVAEQEKENNSPINEDKFKSVVDELYDVLFTIGLAFAVIIGAIIGIKMLLGSIEEQAKMKEMLTPYVWGCVVIFGAFGIWKLVITIMNGVIN